ncbi:MAG: AAA family ATPase [Planctomycetales bacterium]|nr:AAA family ATPase [Planctomycetales bacterium]
MIESLQVEGFRAFQKFSMSGLGRINLIVGENNSGKTSVLEAVQLVASRGDLLALSSITGRRGERFWNETDRSVRSEIDIGHLFYGHDFQLGANLKITAIGGVLAGQLDLQVIPFARNHPTLFEEPVDTGFDPEPRFPLTVLSLRASGDTVQNREPVAFPITFRGGMSLEYARRSRPVVAEGGEIEFVATAGLSIDELVVRFESVVANPEEKLVYEALGCIEPDIERLVTVSSEIRRGGYPSGRGAFYAKLRNVPNRIPLGVMGDGMWRMLAIVLALVRARNGILLIDEIDTGLHHTVVQRMWKLIYEAGAPDKLNVQVFATTHSADCVKALSSICEDNPTARNVSIQRVERDASNSVVIKEDGIIAVTEHNIEVR